MLAKYSKFIVAVTTALGQAAAAASKVGAILTALIGVVGAVGVFAVKNKPAEGGAA